MSGIFWDPSLQPDFMESLTSFGTSTLSLAMAVPMCLVDLVCCLLLSVTGLLTMVLAPVADFLGQVGLMALATSGLEETWSTNHTLGLGLAIYTLIAMFLAKGGAGSYQQTISKSTQLAIGLLWVAAFLSFPEFETATHARVGLLAMALQLASLCVRSLFLEFSGYKHVAPATSLDSYATGYLGVLGMEATVAMVICAFGFPGLSAEDPASRYYCLVPFLAMQIIYFNSVLKVEEAADVTANGHVTVVKEGLEAKIEEVKEVCGEKVSTLKEKLEAASEKVMEEPTAVEAAVEDKVEEVAEADKENTEEVAEAVKENDDEVIEPVKDNIEEVAGAEVVEAVKETVEEKVEEVKADPLFKKLLALLTSIYTCISSHIMILLSPLLSLASTTTGHLAAVPWASLLLLTSTAGSHLLHGAAWHHLTGSSLAFALPVLTLVLPAALEYLAPRLPTTLPPYIQEGAGLAVAATTYMLATGAGSAAQA